MPSDIDFAFALANDSQFRDQLAYALTPVVGTILADNGNGTYTVDTSEGDGGELIARPLDQRTYSVDDFVWCILAFSTADSAIILGSYNPSPDRLTADGVRAASAAGLRLEDAAGNLGAFIENGGQVGIGNAAPTEALDITGNVKASGNLKGPAFQATKLNAVYNAQTFLPAGSVATIMAFSFACLRSTGGSAAGTNILANGAAINLYNAGGQILTMTVNADGSVTLARTGGSGTYNVALSAAYL